MIPLTLYAVGRQRHYAPLNFGMPRRIDEHDGRVGLIKLVAGDRRAVNGNLYGRFELPINLTVNIRDLLVVNW